MELFPRAPSPLRWPYGQRSAGHRERLLCPHFPLLQRLPAGALRQSCSSQPGHSPVIQKPEPWWPWGEKAPASWPPSPVWGQSVLCPRVRGRPAERSGQPHAHIAQRAPPEAALRERSDWKLKPKWSKTAPPPSSKHGKEQSEPAWNAAIKRITVEALQMKWMNLEHMKQGSRSEREKPGL